MKRILYYSLMIVAIAAITTSCNKVSYKKTKSGLLYKIIPAGGKDSVVKPNQWLKLNFIQKLNDSLLQTSYGKAPVYVKIPATASEEYSPMEIFFLLKKGDSAVAVMQIDSLVSKGLMPQMPPFMKKGDKLNWNFKVLDIFTTDSAYMADQKIENEKDAPRREKAEAEEMAKMRKEMLDKQEQDQLGFEKSGEAAKGIKEMEDYIAAKNIPATRVGKGTFVWIKEPGTGPQVANGKYVTINYTGKILAKDSTFDSNSFTRKLGQAELIPGLEEGLLAFKEGGKGVVYIPGFRGYGAAPPPGSPFKAFDPLIFEIEVKKVSDQMTADPQQQPRQQ